MKKNLLLVTLIGGFLYFILSAHSAGPASVALMDCTGVSGSGGCGGTGCHGTTPSPQISDSILFLNDSGHVVNYYVPGNTYTLRIRGYNNSTSILPKFGFQITAVKHGTDSSVGTLIGAFPMAHVTYVTPRLVVAEQLHPLWCSGTGGFGTIYQADVQWLAPSADTVEFRAIVNAVDTNGTASGDLWSAPGPALRIHEGHPPTIFGPKKVCVGATVPISHTPTGGTWTSSDPSIGTVVAPGNVTGISAGTFNLSYTTPNGTTSVVFTVNPMPAAISGIRAVCTGGTSTLSDSMPGGTWSSSNLGIASIGVVNGVVTPLGSAVGSVTIRYTLPTGCYKTTPFTVASSMAVSGTPDICKGDSSLFSHFLPGGTWNSSNTLAASVSSSGMVTGISIGTSVISYDLGTTGCGSQKTVTVKGCTAGITNPFAQTDDIRIFPNPNNGAFSFNVLATADEEAHIVITNVVGAKVSELTVKTNQVNSVMLNQPAGTYFLSATTLSSKHFTKVVVE